MGYNSIYHQLQIYSENFALPPNSPYTYEIVASLAQYPSVTTSAQGVINILDVCDSPFTFSAIASSVSVSADYGQPIAMTHPYLIVDPAICAPQVTYSCSVVTTQQTSANSLCTTFIENNGVYSSSGTFDITNGGFSFTTTDKTAFPPGNYELQITSAIGSKSVTVSYQFTLLDTCATAILSDGVNPFANGPFQYVLVLDTQLVIGYDVDTIVTSSTTINCGPLVLQFSDSTGQTIDPTYFVDDQSDRNNAEFRVGPTTNVQAAGDHFFKFNAYFTDAPANVYESQVFLVAIVNACDPHNDYPPPTITPIDDQTVNVDIGDNF